MNPILPLYYSAPDGEPHVWQNDKNTLYLYASNDRTGGFGMDPWQSVWSTKNLINWKEHEKAFDAREAVDFTKIEQMPAIDCIEKDGQYYYYFTADNKQCVAFSNSPTGPFLEAKPIEGTDFPSCGDPAVFVDDDGCAYLYWGQFSLRGAKLKDNMYELESDTLNTRLITEDIHGFHEGSSMRKRGDTYYLIYCDIDRGYATCLSYAVSKSPLGPFEKRGVIIDNVSCDIAAWNNHGSIVCFKDNWYLVYHRACFGYEMGGRKACIEPIYFDSNGDIAEVVMTTQGVEQPIDVRTKIDAYRSCSFIWGQPRKMTNDKVDMLFGKAPTSGWREAALHNRIRDEKDTGVRSAHYIEDGVHKEYLTKFADGDCAIFRYFNFENRVSKFRCSASSFLSDTVIEIRIDGYNGKCIGKCYIGDTNGTGPWNWHEFECDVEAVDGIHEVCLKAVSGKLHSGWLCDLNWFVFE
ncbi:MAG: family 43 glycosylhydrolase [Suipraeoptans sp.]